MKTKQTKNIIGEKIRDILRQLGLKQQDLVDRTGFTKSYISLVLSGQINVTLETIHIIEKALGTRIVRFQSKYNPKGVGLLNHVPYYGKDCIYLRICKNALSDKKGEHVFNSAWGGGTKEKDIICSECNEDFSPLDKSLMPLVDRIKNTKGLASERDSYNPPRVDLADGRILRKHAQLPDKGATHIDSLHAGIDDEFDYDLTLQYRSTAHTCLKALAYFTPELARNSIFDPVKQFIKIGSERLDDFGIETTIDHSFLPTKGQSIRGDFNHVILYFSKRLNGVIGVFHLLGAVKRSVILSDEWSGDEMVIIVDERVGYEIRGRIWEFADLDENMPDIMQIHQLPNEDRFKVLDKEKFKQWRAASALSYRLIKHLEKLDKKKVILNRAEFKGIEKYAKELWSGALYATENTVSESDLDRAADKFGLRALFDEYQGKNMDISFSKSLSTIGEKILLSFDERLKNIE